MALECVAYLGRKSLEKHRENAIGDMVLARHMRRRNCFTVNVKYQIHKITLCSIKIVLHLPACFSQ